MAVGWRLEGFLEVAVRHKQRPAVLDDKGVAVGEKLPRVLDLGTCLAGAEYQGEALTGYVRQGFPCRLRRIGIPIEQSAIKVSEESEHVPHFKQMRRGVDPIEPVYPKRKDTTG